MGKKVVILGAGLTGLTAAYKLSSMDIDVEIIEREKKYGGLAKSFKHNNYIFDYGPHAFHTKNKKVFFFLKELLGKDLLCIGKKRTKIFFKGKYFDDPLRGTSAIFRLGLIPFFNSVISFLFFNLKFRLLKKNDDSFEGWLTNRFGKYIYTSFFGEYTKKVWGIDPSNLDAKFASERIKPLSVRKTIKNMLFKKKEKNNIQLSNDDLNPNFMYYPRKGIQQLSDILIDKIKKKKCKINFNSKIEGFIIKNNKISNVKYTENKKAKITDCDYVISTIPITELVKLLPKPSNGAILAANSLKFRGATFLFLIANKQDIFNAHWIYYQDSNIIFYRANQNTKFSKELMPTGKTGIIIEMGENYFYENREKVYEKIVSYLEKNKILRKEEIEHYFFDKIKWAYPIYTKNFDKKLEIINKELERIKNIITCGRQGLFRYLDMHHCIRMGMVAAEQILDDKINTKIFEKIYAVGGAGTV